MPTEQKSNESKSNQELKATSDIDEPRASKDDYKSAEISSIEELSQFTEQPLQETVLDKDGFSTTFFLPGITGRTDSNWNTVLYQAYFPCELVAVQTIYQGESTTAASFTIFRKRGAVGAGDGEILFSQIPLDGTAQIIITREGNAGLDKKYRFLIKNDRIWLQRGGAGAADSPFAGFNMTLHFKYSGRGETRLNA